MTRNSLRRYALHFVIVLLVFYPFGVYLYTNAVNRSTTQALIMKSLDNGLRYCFETKASIEALLHQQQVRSRLNPVDRMVNDLDPGRFERNLQRLLSTSGDTKGLISYTGVYKGEMPVLQWGRALPPGAEEIIVKEPVNYRALRERVFKTTLNTPSGVCKVVLPLDLGSRNAAWLVVGIVSPDSTSQLTTLSERLSLRAFRLSLVGTSLLALLAAYILYLNDRTRELEKRLEEEKRLAYIGTLAAGMAHEIRNPLSSVKMNIQMIEGKLGEFGAQVSDYLVNKVGRIHRETARLEETVNNFLAFARPKPLNQRRCNLNESVNDVLEFLEPTCTVDNISLVREFAPNLPQAFIDPEQLGQAVENLVRNAHQAINKDGEIRVRTGLKDNVFEISVSDSGTGIPQHAKDKMFEIFFTTKEGGSGLGLTIVKQIVEAHGGSIAFDTIQGKGATFTMKLPMEKPV